MGFVGNRQDDYARVLFIVFASIAGVLFVYQVLILQQLRLIPVYLLPILSFFICYENVLLYYSNEVGTNSDAAYAGYVFHSLIVPIFITVLFEMVYRLHEIRSAHFFFVPFDEGAEAARIPGVIVVSLIRFLVAGLFVMNILADFNFVSTDVQNVGSGGYEYIAAHVGDDTLILTLVPTMVLSIVAIMLGVAMFRYGNRVSFETSNNHFWKILLIIGFGYAVTHIFGPHYFSWTSNLGDISLLLASTVLVQLVQDDLKLAKTYIDFLKKSNDAFNVRERESQSSMEKIDGDDYLQVNRIDIESFDTGDSGIEMSKPSLQQRVSMGSMYPDALANKIPQATPNSEKHMRTMKHRTAVESEGSVTPDNNSHRAIELLADSPRSMVPDDHEHIVGGRGFV